MKIAKSLEQLGFKAYGTEGTCQFLRDNGIEAIKVEKLSASENTIEELISQDKVDFIVNTPTVGYNAKKDGFKIRRLAIERGMSIFTALDTVALYVDVMKKEGHQKTFNVMNLNKITFDS